MTSTYYTYEQELKAKNIKRTLIEMVPKMLSVEVVSEFAKLFVPDGLDALDFSGSKLRVRTFRGNVIGSHDQTKCVYQWEIEAPVPESEAFVAIRLNRNTNYVASTGFVALGEFYTRAILTNRRLGRAFGFNRPELWSIDIPSNYFIGRKIPDAKHGSDFADSILQDFVNNLSDPIVVDNYRRTHSEIRRKLAEACDTISSFI